MFLYAYVATVKKCSFKNNEIKIFDNLDSSNSMLLSSDKYSFTFSECSFDVDKNSEFSIFYYGGKRRATLKIEKCKFDGKLKSGACFIDGQLISNKSPKLILKNCLFSSYSDKDLSGISRFDLYNQNIENNTMKMLTLVAVMSIFALVAVIIAVITILKNRNNIYDYSNDQNESEEISEKSLA